MFSRLQQCGHARGPVVHCGPACVREEQLRACEAKCHPQKVPEAPGTKDVHALQALLRVWVGVEAHSAKKARQTEQVVSMQV